MALIGTIAPLVAMLDSVEQLLEEPDDEDYEGNHPERVYEIADGKKVPLNAHYEAYWKNGLLASKGTFIDGLRQGFWQRYSENGNISERCFLINYRLGATAYLYDENGQLEKTIGVK